MGVIDGTTTISNFVIITMAVGYLVHKFIDKKYGMKFKSNFELLDYALDVMIDKILVGTDKGLIAVPKFQALKDKIFNRNKKEPERVKAVVDVLKTMPKPPLTTKEKIEKTEETPIVDEDASVKIIELNNRIEEIETNSGLFLSGLQLEMNHLTSKLSKILPDLDYNNGEDKKIEKPEETEDNDDTNTRLG